MKYPKNYLQTNCENRHPANAGKIPNMNVILVPISIYSVGRITLRGLPHLRCKGVHDNAVALPRIKLSKLRCFELINLFSSCSIRLNMVSP